MELWPLLSRLAAGSRVIRLVKCIEDHYPKDAPKPLPAAFRLTKSDIDDGKNRNKQPLFSVWDAGLISVPHAKYNLLLDARDETTPNSYVAFFMNVDEISTIPSILLDVPIAVYSDEDRRPGVIRGVAHAGIQGLYQPEAPVKPSKADKLKMKDIRSQLCDACVRAPDNYQPPEYAKMLHSDRPPRLIKSLTGVMERIRGLFRMKLFD